MRTEILIVAIAVGTFLAGKYAIELAVVVIAWRIGFESADVWCIASSVSDVARSRFALTASFGLAMTTAIIVLMPEPLNFIAGLCLLALLFASVSVQTAIGLKGLALMARVVAFPGIAIFALAVAAREPPNYAALLLAFMLTEVFDSFAVLGGHLFGQHKIFPRLSPKKTFEGLLSGLAILGIAALLLPAVLTISRATVLIVIVAMPLGAVAGDLLGSTAKRAAGVKDYSTVLHGQGGLLDILDAWLVTGPLLAGLWAVIG